MTIKTAILTLAAMFTCCATFAARPSYTLEKGIPDAGKWASSHFRKGVEPPFSFELDGIPSDRFIKKWKFSSTKAPDGTLECVWQDPATALKAICKVRVHADFDEVEWTLAFRNEGKADSPRISEVKAASVQIVPRKGSQGFILNHINGSVGASDDFAPHYTPVTSEALSFRPLEGRSSSGGPAPFFNIISSGSEDSGLVLSIGWSGQWIASFRTDPSSGKLAAEAGMAVFDAFLHPGEEVRMPSISLMAWKGGSGEVNMTGNNKFRRFVLEHHSRKIDGKTAMYPLCGGFNWGEPAPLSEYSAMTTDYARFLIDRYADFDIVPDAMWLDAGWYKNAGDWRGGKNWANTVGSWTEDMRRFPGTLKDLSDRAHEKGTSFMVWFEPERVFKDSDIYNEHREWLLSVPGEQYTFLFNLADPEALKWLCGYMGDFLESRGIDYYRQDFNMDPAPFWAAADKEGRSGITEAKYIAGLYAYWDSLLDRFPDMLIDNCASGGRRLDLETIGRSAPLWRTDYSYGEVQGYQNQTYGLEWFLPMHGTGVYQTDRYDSRSAYSSAMVMNFKLTDIHFNILEMKRVYDEYRSIQEYYIEDYYPLTGTDRITAPDRWIAYELHRRSDDTGIVMAFRRPQSGDAGCKVHLQGLDPAKRYVLTDADSGESVTLTGRELNEGYTLSLGQPRSSLLLRFAPEGQ